MDLLDIGYRVKEAFFDRDAVKSQLLAGQIEPLSKTGAYIRRTAKGLIKRPRQMRLGELPPERRRIFEEAKARNLKAGWGPPTLPFAPSRPGEPPRTPTGLYPETIMFAYDSSSHSVVVGPVALNGAKSREVPNTLEFGGYTTYRGHRIFIEARPHMRPALDRETAKLPELFEGIF